MDTTRLESLLAAGDWKAADGVTRELLCELAGQDLPVKPEYLEAIPCDEFARLEKLWLRASQGRHGFAAVRVRWLAAGGTAEVRRWSELSREDRQALGQIERAAGLKGTYPYETLICSYGYGLVGMVAAAVSWKVETCAST
jgi:GUN4-like